MTAIFNSPKLIFMNTVMLGKLDESLVPPVKEELIPYSRLALTGTAIAGYGATDGFVMLRSSHVHADFIEHLHEIQPWHSLVIADQRDIGVFPFAGSLILVAF